jgi:hypothetical protein
MIERQGPIEVIPQKTRIAIQAQVRFAGCIVRRKWLLAHLWLTRRARHPKLLRVEILGPRVYLHQFRFDAPGDIDDRFASLVCEAYAVGMREHLKKIR